MSLNENSEVEEGFASGSEFEAMGVERFGRVPSNNSIIPPEDEEETMETDLDADLEEEDEDESDVKV
jgi:hypothetical protein